MSWGQSQVEAEGRKDRQMDSAPQANGRVLEWVRKEGTTVLCMG